MSFDSNASMIINNILYSQVIKYQLTFIGRGSFAETIMLFGRFEQR